MILNTTYDKHFVKTLEEHLKKYNPDYSIEYINHTIKDICKSFIRQSLDTLSREELTKEIIEEYKKDFCHLLDEYYNVHVRNEEYLDKIYGKKK